MEDSDLLLTILDRSNSDELFPNNSASARKYKRSASVACIFRVSIPSNQSKFSTIEEFTADFRQKHSSITENNEIHLEILLIRRAIRTSDPWSGDFAFPGGHIEAGETALDAAIRETTEEIGLNLSVKQRFLHCGSLPSRHMKTRKGAMLIIPHLFVDFSQVLIGNTLQNQTQNQLKTGTSEEIMSEFILSPDEVEHVRWVKMREISAQLHNNALSGVWYSLFNSNSISNSDRNSGKVSKTRSDSFANTSTITVSIHDRYLSGLKVRNKLMFYVMKVVLFCVQINALVLTAVHLSTDTNDNNSNNSKYSSSKSKLLNENDSTNGSNSVSKSINNLTGKTLPLWGLTYFILCDILVLDKESHRNNTNNSNRNHKLLHIHKHLKYNKLMLTDNNIVNKLMITAYKTVSCVFGAQLLRNKYIYIVLFAVGCYVLFQVSGVMLLYYLVTVMMREG